MVKRTMGEMITHFNDTVSTMDISVNDKMTLLGMITAIGYEYQKAEDAIEELQKQLSSADVAEAKRGVWVLDDPKQFITHCSNCNWLNVHYTWSYCPNCGARMGGEVVKQDQGYYYVNGIDLTEHLQCSDNH